MIKSVCLFCGGRPGIDPAHMQLAAEFGQLLASRKIRLVYGGGKMGLMGAAADAALAGGGLVTGIIPHHLVERELMHPKVTDMRFVANLGERKNMMLRLADAIVVLPGGLGTLDEVFEVLTQHRLLPPLRPQPIFILAASGFWQHLHTLIDGLQKAGFVPETAAELYEILPDLDALALRLS